MDLDLTGKVVLVTGGASGIGAAIVRAIAAEGGVPIVVDRNAAAAREIARELNASGARVAPASRSTTIDTPPSAAMARTMAAPMPLAPPVTRTTLPVSSRSIHVSP